MTTQAEIREVVNELKEFLDNIDVQIHDQLISSLKITSEIYNEKIIANPILTTELEKIGRAEVKLRQKVLDEPLQQIEKLEQEIEKLNGKINKFSVEARKKVQQKFDERSQILQDFNQKWIFLVNH